MLKPFPKIGAAVFVLTAVSAISVIAAPRSVSGWPVNIGPVYYASVAIGDISDNDGKEVVVCTFDGDLFTVDSSGRVINRFSATVTPGSAAKETSASALADVDEDGSLDIIHSSTSGLLSVYDSDGRLKDGWPVDLSGDLLSPPVIQDLTQYPGLEIVVSAETQSGANIYGLHADGTPISGWPISLTGDSVNISLGDIDNDGTADILVTSGTRVFAYDYRGEVLFGWPVDLGAEISAPVVIADLDFDERAEVLVGAADGYAYALSGDGDIRPGWPVRIGFRPITSPAAIANIDGVAGLEAIFMAGSAHIGDSQLGVIGEAGRMLPGFPKRLSYSIAAAPLAFDVEGDGLAEIFLVTGGGSVLAIDGDARYLPGYPLDMERGKITATPSAADIDNDGDTDVIIATEDGYLLAIDLTASYDKNAAPWPTYQGNRWRGGKYHEESDSEVEFAVETRGGSVTIKWSAKPSSEREYWEVIRAERTGEGLSRFENIAEIEQTLKEKYTYTDKNVAGSSIYSYKIKEYLVNGSVNTYGPKIIKTNVSPKKTAGITELIATFPNPFTTSTTITFRVAEADSGFIGLSVYDLSGKTVRELKRDEMRAGTFSVAWDGYDGNGNELPPGVYVCRLRPESGGKTSTKSIVLIR